MNPVSSRGTSCPAGATEPCRTPAVIHPSPLHVHLDLARTAWHHVCVTEDDAAFYEKERAFHEALYLATDDPRKQSGFGRDAQDWERFRRPIVAAIHRSGSFLDIGCANGLLMESIVGWAGQAGHAIEPYGLDISERLAALARSRLPQWAGRIFVDNAFCWRPPRRFDFVRTELVYVPASRREEYLRRLVDEVVTPSGRLIICSYGSSRPEGQRAELMMDDFASWGIPVAGVEDAVSAEHGFVITRVVWIEKTW